MAAQSPDIAMAKAMRGYLAALALGGLAAFGLLLVALAVLAERQMLPAPRCQPAGGRLVGGVPAFQRVCRPRHRAGPAPL